jgi:HlyD family secretion protein
MKRSTIFLASIGLLGLLTAIAALVPVSRTEETPRRQLEATDDKRWQAVAPGQVEPRSGEIKLAAPTIGRVIEVLVKPNDKVFTGELLIRLDDDEAQARLVAAEAQIALRKRARNDQSPSSRAADRRKAEDAVANAERIVADARSALDKAAAARRAGTGTDTDLDASRLALSQAQDRLKLQRAELHRIEADADTPLPSQTEGQLNVARTDWTVAETMLARTAIRAPIAGTVLQVNVKSGELATPSSIQPLIVLGDVSALRVRAELDERDFGEIKIGHEAVIRAAAIRGREFAGKVSTIAPIVEPGRMNSRGQRNVTDVNVVEVIVDLAEPGPLAVGMKADVYFRFEGPQRQ